MELGVEHLHLALRFLALRRCGCLLYHSCECGTEGIDDVEYLSFRPPSIHSASPAIRKSPPSSTEAPSHRTSHPQPYSTTTLTPHEILSCLNPFTSYSSLRSPRSILKPPVIKAPANITHAIKNRTQICLSCKSRPCTVQNPARSAITPNPESPRSLAVKRSSETLL